MRDNRSSKRPALVALLLASFIAALASAGYFYWYKKPADSGKTPPPLKKLPTATVNGIKTPTTAEALTALFGIKTSANKIANAADQLSGAWFEQSFAQHNDKFHAVFIKTQNIDPETKAISDSHVDAANISVVVYKLVDKQWQLFSKQINVGSFGSWGDVPEIKQVPTLQLSPNNLAFLIESGSSGQGYTETGKGLFVYNAKTKIWKDLGFIQIGGDNSGACDDSLKPTDCWKFTGEITLTKSGKNPEYPDLLVVQKGTTSDDNNKIVPVSKRLIIFNGEQYVEKGAEAR